MEEATKGLLSLVVALAAFGCGTAIFEATCNDRSPRFVSRATITSTDEGEKSCLSEFAY
jgi:hypothetical protein